MSVFLAHISVAFSVISQVRCEDKKGGLGIGRVLALLLISILTVFLISSLY